MTIILEKGRYRARQSRSAQDIERSLALRRLAFGCDDGDDLDARCTHVLVEDVRSGEVLCSFRMMLLVGAGLDHSYSAQFYDLTALAGFPGAMVEMGRFCTHPDHSRDPDLLRLAWAAMTRFVDRNDIEMLFGCSSFAGTNGARYQQSFSLLWDKFLAPTQWRPQQKAQKVYRFETLLADKSDAAQGYRAMPALLRTYLTMGGWVSDHAVIDDKMKTLHVFTGVLISAIPASRKRLLRAVAG